MAVDYLWNAWHFASQHHGIYRIYSCRSGLAVESASRPCLALEKWSMRGFLLYVILRTASATWSETDWHAAFSTTDAIAALVPAALLVGTIYRSGLNPPGRVIYLASVSGLYASLLWAVHIRRPDLVLSLATASALFHAIEYLAVVSWSVRARHQSLVGRGAVSLRETVGVPRWSAHGREVVDQPNPAAPASGRCATGKTPVPRESPAEPMGLLGYLVPRWGLALALFILILGAGGWWFDTQFVETWLFINVIVAFLHYAYDGLIWRRPRAVAASRNG
jgi:hypothetical protein